MSRGVSRYFTATLGLTVAYIKRFFRDKVALFFTFLFPVMFLLVFGALNNGNNGPSFEVAMINRSATQFSQQFVQQAEKQESLKINKEVTSIDDARERMGRGELDSIMELPESFGQPNAQGIPSGKLIVYYEEASPQSGQTLAAVMQGVLDAINKELTKTSDPFTVESKSTATANLSSFDYVFSGLLGFAILSLGIFGLASSFPAEKKTGAFRRIRVAPVNASQLILANGLNYMLAGLLSIAAMLVVALIIFDFNMRGDYLSFWLYVTLGIIMMFGMGLALSGWAKNEVQAAPLANLVAFPMMFLSGMFFPRFLMPEWLQNITTYIPLSPIVDGLRLIATEGKTLFDLGPQLAIIGVWTVVIYVIAFKVFRWE